jgi:hypothetical protein
MSLIGGAAGIEQRLRQHPQAVRRHKASDGDGTGEAGE